MQRANAWKSVLETPHEPIYNFNSFDKTQLSNNLSSKYLKYTLFFFLKNV